MKWSDRAHQLVQPIYHQILVHPFISQLTDGTLEQEKFIFYIRQDALYLAEYGKVLAGLAAKLQDSQHRNDFLRFAGETITVENVLHDSFLRQTDKDSPFEASPACLLYTSYLHKQLASESVAVAAAAVLPCFWIYKDVGDYILQCQQKSANPYQDWIDTYGGEEYAGAVHKAIEICDTLAARSTAKEQETMSQVFAIGVRLEWMFWDSAWRLEQWRV